MTRHTFTEERPMTGSIETLRQWQSEQRTKREASRLAADPRTEWVGHDESTARDALSCLRVSSRAVGRSMRLFRRVVRAGGTSVAVFVVVSRNVVKS